MSAETDPANNPVHLHVGVWNILLDHKRHAAVLPQDERLQGIADTIAGMPWRFDALAILEAEEITEKHNGRELAQMLGYGEGHWSKHSRRNHGEHLGMFGDRVEHVGFHELPYKKNFCITHIGKIAFAGTHLMAQFRGPYRSARGEQARALVEYMQDEEHGIIALDANGLPAKCFLPPQEARRVFEDAGYRSVFDELGRRHPNTAMTDPKYFHGLKKSEYIALRIMRGLSIDDIYVKNVPVLDADVQPGPSDHKLVWAELDATGLVPAAA